MMEALPLQSSPAQEFSSSSPPNVVANQPSMTCIDLTKVSSEELPKYATAVAKDLPEDCATGHTGDSLKEPGADWTEKEPTKVSTETVLHSASNTSTQVMLSNGSVQDYKYKEYTTVQSTGKKVPSNKSHKKVKMSRNSRMHPKSAGKSSDRAKNVSADKSEMHRLADRMPELQIFKLHRKIGEGTFSRVYLASLLDHPEQVFALKHHVPTASPNRVQWELKCLQDIGGRDNVIGVQCAFRRGDYTVFVMPYLEHKRFSDIVLDMGVSESRRYIHGLLVALARVHSFGVIHRDVKPSNYLYNRETRECLLIDFGLANRECDPKPDSCGAPLRMHLSNNNISTNNVTNKYINNSTNNILDLFNNNKKNVYNSKNNMYNSNKIVHNGLSNNIFTKYKDNSNSMYNGSNSKNVYNSKNVNNKRSRDETLAYQPASKRRALQTKLDDNVLPPVYEPPPPGTVSPAKKRELTENRNSAVYRMAHTAVKKKLFDANNENNPTAEPAPKPSTLMQPRVPTFATPGNKARVGRKENVETSHTPTYTQGSGRLGQATPQGAGSSLKRPQTQWDIRSSMLASSSTPRQILMNPDKAGQASRGGLETGAQVLQNEPRPAESPKFQNLTPSRNTGTSYLRVQDSKVKSSSGLFASPTTSRPACSCFGKGAVCKVCLARPAKLVARAGTPGFRPPEVLFKYDHQTTAVDMWAAGVVLLSLLSASYPFFRAPNDIVALSEITVIFGSEKMKQVANILGRRVEFSNAKRPLNIRKLCEALRRRRHTPGINEGCPVCPECLQYVDPAEGCICDDDPTSNLACESTALQGTDISGTMSQGSSVDDANSQEEMKDFLRGDVREEKASRCEREEEVDGVFPASAYDLLSRLLDLNPHTRISAEEALQHPFFRVA